MSLSPAIPPTRRHRWLKALAAATLLAGAAGAAQAGDVRWRIGVDLPLPGVVFRPAPVYAPPRVVYAPPPAYAYGPEVVRYERHPRFHHHPRYDRYDRHPGYGSGRYERRYDGAPVRVVVRPAPPRRHWHGD